MRGQITVFMILGLVLFVAFAMLFYFSATMSKAKLERGVVEGLEDTIRDGKIDSYVELCLKKSTGDGVLLLGQQGGYLFAPPLQNGTVPLESVPTFRFGSANVGIGVRFPPAIASYPEEPDYPLRSTPLFESQLLRPELRWLGMPWGYFGQKSLPPLCDPDGPNNVSERIRQNVSAPCNKGFYGPDSIQEQLSAYIAEELKGCTDLSTVAENFGIASGDPIVTVTLGETNLFVNASYPINFTDRGERLTEYLTFETFLPIRLRKVYGYLDSLLLLDTFYANYSMDEHFMENNRWDPQLSVERVCPGCPTDPTEIITVTDRASIINSKPFAFRTAVQNRRPALEYLHERSFPNTAGLTVDYVVPVGGQMGLFPSAVDPDDEDRALRFTYGKWREDYADEFLGFSCCFQDLDAYQRCRDTLFTSCMRREIPPQPREWSTAMRADGASSITTELPRDVGFHTVRIMVNDSTYGDYQDIGIFVTPFASDIASTGFRCGMSEGSQDPLACVCAQSAGADAACDGMIFEQIAAGTCIGTTFCGRDCRVMDPNQDVAACSCTGGTFLGAGGQTACCGATDCIRGNSAGADRCLARGQIDSDPRLICGPSGNTLPCASGNECRSYSGSYCNPTTNSWQPLPPGGAPSVVCPTGVVPL